MTKIFVIVGEHGRHEDYTKDIICAGIDEKSVDEKAVKSWHDDIIKEVWVSEILVQTFSLSENRREWNKVFDLREKLEKEVEKSREELQEKELKLKEIKAVFNE